MKYSEIPTQIIFDGITFYLKKGTNYYYSSANHQSYKALHHYIWEYYNKRKIIKGNVIHHIDFNPHNNNISNLQYLSLSRHIKLHALERFPRKFTYKEVKCEICSKLIFTRATCGKRFCNKQCYHKYLMSLRQLLNLICVECKRKFQTLEHARKSNHRITCSIRCSKKHSKKLSDKDVSNVRSSGSRCSRPT